MKRNTIRTLTALALGLAFAVSGYASEKGHGGMKNMDMKKGGMKGMEMKGGMDMAQMGDLIHESTVEDHQLTYRLIDMKQKMKMMKGMNVSMKGMDMGQVKSHHLMVFAKGTDDHEYEEAKVGYKVTAPDGTEQKAMAMGMKGGYGADVDFKAKGAYTIKTKIVMDETQLVDEFQYVVK